MKINRAMGPRYYSWALQFVWKLLENALVEYVLL